MKPEFTTNYRKMLAKDMSLHGPVPDIVPGLPRRGHAARDRGKMLAIQMRGTNKKGRTLDLLHLAAHPDDFGRHLYFHNMQAILRKIQRYFRITETPPVLSQRGVPQAQEIHRVWARIPRTLCDILRMGSRLADLTPTLDASFSYITMENGQNRLISRGGGMKGWLREHCPSIKYSTAMHYKKLASRIHQLCEVNARIPLEWLLVDNEEDIHLPRELEQAFREAKHRVAVLLASYPKVTALTQAVEKRLGLLRMVTIRRARAKNQAKFDRKIRRKGSKKGRFTLVSQIRIEGWAVGVLPRQAAGLQEAIDLIMVPPNPDGERLNLQAELVRWFCAPLEERA